MKEQIMVIVAGNDAADARKKATDILDKYISINNKNYTLTHSELFEIIGLLLNNSNNNAGVRNTGNSPIKIKNNYKIICDKFGLEYNNVFSIISNRCLPKWEYYDNFADDDILLAGEAISFYADQADEIPDIFIDQTGKYINFAADGINHSGFDSANELCRANIGRRINKMMYITRPEVQDFYMVRVWMKL